MKEFDVAVVGAGPAGSSAAMAAAKNGAKVLLLERKKEIGLPCHCAGGVTRRIEKLVELNREVVATEITSYSWCTSAGEEVSFGSKDKLGYILRRDVLDKELAMLAVKAGAELTINADVTGISGKLVDITHMGEKTQVKAQVIIGADGVGSKIARWAGLDLPSEVVSCIQFKLVGVSLEECTTHIYWGKNWAPGGYAWIFPRENGQAMVGIGVRKAPKPAYNYLMDFIKKHPAASPRLKGSTVIGISGGSVPLETAKKTVSGNVLIVGDAAGQVNSVNGAGIDYAIICGRIAGEVAAEAIHRENPEKTLTNYEKMWRQTLGKEFKACLTAKKILDRMDNEQLDLFINSLKGEDIFGLMTSFNTRKMFMLAVRKAPTLFGLVGSFFSTRGN